MARNNKIYIDPATTYTLDDFISMQLSDNMTYYNFSIIEIMDGVEHTSSNVIEEYLDELKKECLTVELTNVELKKYKYHPDLLSYALYGTTQLDFVLMLLNDTIDPKEFIKKTIILPYASSLFDFLDSVYSSESIYLDTNRSQQGLK